MTIIAAILHLLAGYGHECIATRFGDPGDKWVGGKAIALGRRVNANDIGVAHRRVPMGAVFLICIPRTGKCALAPVIDRGPFGAMYRGEWRLKIRRRDPGRWRACIDLTPALSDKLGHNGYERAVYTEVTR